ncbi:hypothetical protein SUDANB15_07640 (plasmid) [Streptomyces sp. enrichment culture]|uniref:hypothetical protein n=1 Tax=Streptomyces sp. enrichment culture TaxID=1795815 RepID=UPI003F54F4E3
MTVLPPGTAPLLPGTPLRRSYDLAADTLGDRLLRRQPVKIALWALPDYAGDEHKAVYLLGSGTFDLLYTGSTSRGLGTVRARVNEHRRDTRKAEVTWVLVLPVQREADVEQAEGEVGRLLGRPRLSQRLPRLNRKG